MSEKLKQRFMTRVVVFAAIIAYGWTLTQGTKLIENGGQVQGTSANVFWQRVAEKVVELY